MKTDSTSSDPRDGSMAGINGPMPPLQAETFRAVPVEWADIPRIGVHSLIVRALKDRGLVETRWAAGLTHQQWRRRAS